MPRRFTRRKNRYRTKRRGRRVGVNRGTTASKALYLAKKALNMVPRPERKYLQWNQGSVEVTTTGAVYNLLPGLTHGTSVSALLGNTANLKNISLRFTIQRAGYTTPVIYRVIMFRYWDENGTAFAIGNIGNLLQTTPYTLSEKNQNKTQSSTIIYDRTYDFSNIGFIESTGTDSNVQRFHKWSFNLQKSSHRPYKINTANDIESGGLYLFVVATDPVLIVGRAITFYTDA